MKAAVAAVLAVTLVLATPAAAQSPVIATVDGSGEITKAQFDHWLRIAAISRAGPDPPRPVRVPRPGTRRWRSLKGQVMQLLIQNLWVSGEAAERGITVTEEEIDRAFEEQRRLSFPRKGDFGRFLRTSGFTRADIRYRIRLEQLSNRVRRAVLRAVPELTEEELRAYYDENRSEFVLPERREVRFAIARTRAAAIAKRKRRRTVTRDDVPTVVFRRRRGVVRRNGLWLAFRVVRLRPRRTQSFEEARPIIDGTLTLEREQEALDTFIEEFQDRWRARTECRERYATRDCGRRIP